MALILRRNGGVANKKLHAPVGQKNPFGKAARVDWWKVTML
jgi:hypothetical protein